MQVLEEKMRGHLGFACVQVVLNLLQESYGLGLVVFNQGADGQARWPLNALAEHAKRLVVQLLSLLLLSEFLSNLS